MSSGPSPDTFLSIRTSCDRCRFQKLKCSIPASSEAPKGTICCQRCARAMVPCVFSRRNRSRRTTTDSYSDRKWSRTRSATGLISDKRGVTATNCHNPSISDARGPSPVDEKISIIIPKGPTALETEAFSFEDGWNQVSTQDTLALNGAPGTDGADDSSLGYAFQEDSAMDDMQLFTNGISLVVQDDGGELSLANYGVAPASSDTSGDNNSSNGSTAFEANVVISERGNTIGMLLSLASDLYTRLEALENMPRQQRETLQALDGYPIGSVLHLSQEFTNIARALRKIRLGDESEQIDWMLGSDLTPLGGDCITTATPSPCVDTSTTLILLSCYVTLTQICTIILGHFQAHLNSQPASRIRAALTSAKVGPQVCLGDLPTIDTPYSRIHMAVCMLLGSLSQAEKVLGLPPQLRAAGLQPWGQGSATENKTFPDSLAEQDLASALGRWEELTSVTSIQESFTVLGKKVADIKELLREKMGL
ncbi:hypothetical protein DL764_005859 [Monosporascus ibericus]|uniref:Zn(2)-C6 fungal-type domain-containing protein n=1 Tax=Monosporascus ibericus TaxID=155417 RepID=A0A4Q4T739_9PEZI|nr:hypothetical protein DL764_005859 [Monosporascus ibericus]